MNEERNEEREAKAAVKAALRPYKTFIKSLLLLLFLSSCFSFALGAWLLAITLGFLFVALPIGLAIWASRQMPAGDLERSIFPMALEHSGVGVSRIPKGCLFFFLSSRLMIVPYARAKAYFRAAEGGEVGTQWLLDQIGSSTAYDRWRALVTLTQMREERVIPDLRRALGDPDASVREVASKSLAAFGCADMLADALSDQVEDFVWLYAAAAKAAQERVEIPEWRIVRLKNSIPADSLDENGWDQSRAAAVGALPIEAAEDLVRELLNRQSQLAVPVLTNVGKQRTDAARSFLGSLLSDPRTHVAKAAIFGLGNTEDKAAIPVLERLQTEHDDEDVKRTARLVVRKLERISAG